jgi:hypothetical protein
MFGIGKRKMFAVTAALVAAACATSRNSAFGFVAELTDNNSTLSYNTVDNAASWVVDGVDQFGGSPAGGDSLQYFNGTSFVPLSGLTVVTPPSFSGNLGSVTLGGTLDGDNFTVGIQAILVGGKPGSGVSGINETISVNDLGPAAAAGVQRAISVGNPVDFIISDTFDANLNATPNNDTLTLSPSGSPFTAVQTDPAGVKLTYVTTPTPTSFALINNGSSSSTVGPETGNEAFNFVWDLSLTPGDTGIISNAITLSGADTSVPAVPLPNPAASSLATLTGLGIIGIIRRRRATV